MDKVVRPQIPYRGPIPGGLHDGKLIEIKGHVPYGADVFTINFLTGLDPNSDRPLHISVRLNNHVVVRNTFQCGSWGPEERQGMFPFSTGSDFTVTILVCESGYRIAVNHQHCWEYGHRIPYSRVSSILIDGSVKIERIEFVDKINPYQQPGPFMPPSTRPGVYPIPGIQPSVCPMAPSYIQPSAIIAPPPEQHVGFPTSNSVLSPVYNPPIPYAYPIYGGMKLGMMMYISGRPSASPYKFTINLQSGTAPYPPPDIAFHFDVRFYDRSIIRNTRFNGTWASEERAISHFPFQPAVNFDMIIKVEPDRYMVALNGQHFLEFHHRLTPLSRFDTLSIENDVIISSIRFA